MPTISPTQDSVPTGGAREPTAAPAMPPTKRFESTNRDGLALAAAQTPLLSGRNHWDDDVSMQAQVKARMVAQDLMDAKSTPQEFVQHPKVRALLDCMQTQAAAQGIEHGPVLELDVVRNVWLAPWGLCRLTDTGGVRPIRSRRGCAKLDFAGLSRKVDELLHGYATHGTAPIQSGRRFSPAFKAAVPSYAGAVGAAICGALVAPEFFFLTLALPMVPLLAAHIQGKRPSSSCVHSGSSGTAPHS